MATYYVRKGIYEKDGFRVVRDLHPVPVDIFEEFCEFMEDYFISLDSANTSSYDDSDDERVGGETRRISYSQKIRKIDPREQSESLLMVDNKIVGVVFVVNKGKSDEYTRAFSFDGKIAQTMRLGYYASHSSSFTYVDRVSLVKKGSKEAPKEARQARFYQSEMYPDL